MARIARRSRRRSLAAAVATLAALLGTIIALRWLGGPLANPLDAPRVTRVGDIAAPVAVALGLIRAAAFAACLYGVALSATAIAAILTRSTEIERVATSMAPPFLRAAMAALIGLGALTSAATPRPDTHRQPTAAPAARPAPTTTTPTATPPTASTTVPPATVPTAEAPDQHPPRPDHAGAVGRAEALPRMWVIEPGDHLWRVASITLAQHLGRRPVEDEVRDYWRRVIELNRESLVEPDNPDLVLVGQVIELPPPEG